MTDVARENTPTPRTMEVSELAAAQASRAERDNRLSAKVFDAIRDAGFNRHFVPARWGGSEGGFGACLDAVAAVARQDPSTGWCAAIAATLGRMAGFLPDAGQRAVWAAGPDAFVVGALVPGGEATTTTGGWLLSGRWPYVSGVHASDCALLACRVPMPGEEPQVRFLLVPRSAYRVEETWRMTGMRATGSDTAVIEQTFVPVEHSFVNSDLLSGRAPGTAPACLTVPLRDVSGLTFAGPVLGAARGALDAWSRIAARRRSAAGATIDSVLARSAAETDAAQLLLNRVALDADQGRLRDEWSGARAQRDQALAADLLVGAVNRLMRTGGTSAFDEDVELQRFWRDANVGASHAVLQWEPAARRFAAASLDPSGAGPSGDRV